MTKRTIILNKTQWIRSIQPGETKTGYVNDHNELDSLSTLVARDNKGYGFERNCRIHYRSNWKEKSFTISCYKIEVP